MSITGALTVPSKSFGCDFDAIASYSQEGAIASDKDCGNTNAQHTIKTTEIGAGKGIRQMNSRVGIADKHTDRLCGHSRICLVMELLEGGTLVVSHVVVFPRSAAHALKLWFASSCSLQDVEHTQHDGTR